MQVNPLLNEQATKTEIEDGIDWLRRQVTEGDIGVVFLSGHGKNDLQGDYFFLPYDVDDVELFATAVSKDSLRKTFDHTVGKVVVFLDTCHAGGVQMASTKGAAPDINGLVNELARAGRGVVVFASSTGTQLSIELDDAVPARRVQPGASSRRSTAARRARAPITTTTARSRQTNSPSTSAIASRRSPATSRRRSRRNPTLPPTSPSPRCARRLTIGRSCPRVSPGRPPLVQVRRERGTVRGRHNRAVTGADAHRRPQRCK